MKSIELLQYQVETAKGHALTPMNVMVLAVAAKRKRREAKGRDFPCIALDRRQKYIGLIQRDESGQSKYSEKKYQVKNYKDIKVDANELTFALDKAKKRLKPTQTMSFLVQNGSHWTNLFVHRDSLMHFQALIIDAAGDI
jgi:hypothetical protein